MKALSIKQPWASLICSGRKRIELRTWKTNYRGPLLVCASVAPANTDPARVWDTFRTSGPRGVSLCMVELVDVRPATREDQDEACHPIELGRHFAWVLGRRIEAVQQSPVRGRLGFFDV